MRVAPNIHLVASETQGRALTDDLDCTCWLFDAGGPPVLLDTGAAADVDRIVAVLREDGIAPERLTHVFLTHTRADHSGGAAAIKQRTGCTLLCGEATAGLLGRGEDAFSLTAARRAGVYPPDYAYRRPVPGTALAANDVVSVGTVRITAIPTPGHSLDHTSFLVEQAGGTARVTGDAMMQVRADHLPGHLRRRRPAVGRQHPALTGGGRPHGLRTQVDGCRFRPRSHRICPAELVKAHQQHVVVARREATKQSRLAPRLGCFSVARNDGGRAERSQLNQHVQLPPVLRFSPLDAG